MSARLIWLRIARDAIQFLALCFRSRTSLAVENLFLRKQLAFYQERKVRPRRADNPTRLTMVLLSRHFDWRNALTVVKPKTLLAWHRKAFWLFWRWKSKCGRRPIPSDLQHLIRTMARENPSWGEERIVNELLLPRPACLAAHDTEVSAEVAARAARPASRRSTLGDVSEEPRSVYRGLRFLRPVTATFRFLYVFVAVEHASRRVLRLSATAHPTAAWTLQQLRETIPSDHQYRFIIHDHDSIFSSDLDASLARLGLKAIRTPVRSPQANSICERLIGTLRRECLDWIIPLSAHLRRTLTLWMPLSLVKMTSGQSRVDSTSCPLSKLHPRKFIASFEWPV